MQGENEFALSTGYNCRAEGHDKMYILYQIKTFHL